MHFIMYLILVQERVKKAATHKRIASTVSKNGSDGVLAKKGKPESSSESDSDDEDVSLHSDLLCFLSNA